MFVSCVHVYVRMYICDYMHGIHTHVCVYKVLVFCVCVARGESLVGMCADTYV